MNLDELSNQWFALALLAVIAVSVAASFPLTDWITRRLR